MQMYDIYVGEVVCPHCNNKIHFEEATKKYACEYKQLKPGDYIAAPDVTHAVEIHHTCTRCGEHNITMAAVKNGQLIGYFPKTEHFNLNAMKNIEEGYQRKLEYEQMCECGCGWEREYTAEDFHVGDILTLLQQDWIVEAVFEEVIREDVEAPVLNKTDKNNRHYRVKDVQGKHGIRFISFRKEYPVYITKEYFGTMGTMLVKVE